MMREFNGTVNHERLKFFVQRLKITQVMPTVEFQFLEPLGKTKIIFKIRTLD